MYYTCRNIQKNIELSENTASYQQNQNADKSSSDYARREKQLVQLGGTYYYSPTQSHCGWDKWDKWEGSPKRQYMVCLSLWMWCIALYTQRMLCAQNLSNGTMETKEPSKQTAINFL